MTPISLQIKFKPLIITHKALWDLSPSNIDHLLHQILAELRGFAQALPLPGMPAPTPGSPSFFVRLVLQVSG